MKNLFFKLPFSFDAAMLLNDLSICLQGEWPLHFNTKDYAGNWRSISLRSASGKHDDIYSVPSVSSYTNTSLLDKCPFFMSIINSFQCELETVRLLNLSPGSIIREHRDPGAGYEHGYFRIHIPITTDEGVLFKVGGELLRMNPGECWYADFDMPHSVEHKGTKERIHMVIDGIRNQWSDKLFAESGYDFEEEKRRKDYDNVTKAKMIEELSFMNTDVSRALIAQLKAELGINN